MIAYSIWRCAGSAGVFPLSGGQLQPHPKPSAGYHGRCAAEFVLRYYVGEAANGLEQQIERFLTSHPDTALIIDTLQRIRSGVNDANPYASDYRDLGILKELADKRRIAILLIHHLRKMNDDDPMNMISGTTGISGATDTNFVLRKSKRSSNSATLYCTGRDIEYRELLLEFDGAEHVWKLSEDSVAQTARDEFEAVKKQFHKTDGRGYYHIVQSFSPDDPLDFETAHEIGLKFAEYFQGYQCVVATHMNTDHIHNHIIMNSVNFETGRKFHQSAREMQQAKEFSNQLCLQYGLSVTETKADPNRIPAWKKRLRRDIKQAMELCYDREQFIHCMEAWGYGIKWEEGHKHITYTTPENMRCRDSKIFDQTLLRENMEHYSTRTPRWSGSARSGIGPWRLPMNGNRRP